jgi:hypothetical protein
MAPALQLLLLASALAHGSWRVLAAEEGASTQQGAPEEGDDGVPRPEPLDPTLGGCYCRQSWTVAPDTCANNQGPHRGCGMASPCDGDDGDMGYTWCYIEEPRPGCMPEAANWDWCLPGVQVYDTAPPPPEPCTDQSMLAFDCPARVAMLVSVLVALCGCACACGVRSLRQHLSQRRAFAKYGSDDVEAMAPARQQDGLGGGGGGALGAVEQPAADDPDQIKPSPGLEVLGRGVRLEIAPHLAAAAAAQPPSEVIPCGGLTQVAVHTLGLVVAPAVLGQESGTYTRAQARSSCWNIPGVAFGRS